jgi:alpha-L-arabinofuranosidase
MPKPLICFILIIISVLNSASAQHNIQVNASSVLTDVSHHPVGINVSHLMDDGFLQPAPTTSTTQSLKNMGVKFLRFPGGEKSDNYLWSVSPWDKPNPRAARPGNCEWPSNDTRFINNDFTTFKSLTLDFDEFMTMCRNTGSEPLITVAYDCMYKAGSCGSVPTREQLLRTAEEWVRYANITKKYGVKYWMIGNESFMSCSYNGCATAAQYRDDVILFSQRMKAVDPSIKIIANGEKSSWWQTVLPTAAKHIDFLGISNYPIWQYSGGYDYYRTRNPDLLKEVTVAINGINQHAPSSERERLKVIVSEFGSMDWQGSWADNNDIGHAIVLFDMMGQQLINSKVHSSYFWNTRWVNNATKANDIYDALNKSGGLNANGLILSVWGKHLLKQMVQASSNTQIRTFASRDQVTGKLNIFLINKETSAQNVNLSVSNYASSASGKRWEYKGSGPSSVNPTWAQNGTVALNNSALSLSLPATSVTVLEFTTSTVTTSLQAPTAEDKSRCGSGTLTLTASGGVGYRWYKNPSGGSVLATSSNFTTPTLAATDSFYVSNFDGTNESSRTRVRAIINSIPSEPTAQDQSRCGNGSVTFTASGGTNYKWYENISGGNSIHTGSNFTTPSLSESRSYYVSSFNSICESTRREVKAIINFIPSEPSAQDQSRCGDGSVTFTASGGTNYKWYDNVSGGNAVHTGLNFTTPSLSASRSYYVTSFNSNCESTRREVKAIINSIPSEPSVQDQSRCGNGSVTFIASGGTNYKWYENISGGNAIHTGTSFTTPSLSDSRSYYVSSFNSNCESSRTEVKAIINSIPSEPSAQDQSRCGYGSVTFTATGGTNYKWYENASGGNAIHTGSNFTTPSLSASRSYYVTSFNSNCESTRKEVKVIINSIPSEPTAQDQSRCGNGSVSFTASGDTNYKWYDNISGGNAIHTGSNFTTPSLSASRSYYVSSFNSNCESSRIEVKAIIINLQPPTAHNNERCGTGQLVLSASNGQNYRWYNHETQGNAIATGTEFTTPVLTNTDTFWVASALELCRSQRVPAIAIVHPIPETPVITLSPEGLLVASSTGTNYEWLLNDEQLPVNSQTISATESGIYTVRAQAKNGCWSEFSEVFVFTTTGIISHNNNTEIRIYPNPNYGIFTIHLISEEELVRDVKIYNTIGQIIHSQTVFTGKNEISPLIAIAPGVYFITVGTAETRRVEKVIVR